MPIKLIIADDHPLYLDGLKLILAQSKKSIIGTAQNGTDAIRLANTNNADVLKQFILNSPFMIINVNYLKNSL